MAEMNEGPELGSGKLALKSGKGVSAVLQARMLVVKTKRRSPRHMAKTGAARAKWRVPSV